MRAPFDHVRAARGFRGFDDEDRSAARALAGTFDADVENERDTILTDPRWSAVVARDARYDGAFVYAVRTTGVYCRPSCGARLPRPDHVELHDSPDAARRAGFRACRRCRPDGTSAAEGRASEVAHLCRRIEAAERVPDLGSLARASGGSASRLYRRFAAETGLTPRAYAEARRAARIRTALDSAGSVTEAIYAAGFESSGRFYEAVSKSLGMTPTEWRSAGEGTTIRFAVGQCSLGAILVAATGRGVCAIFLGDDPDELVRDLEDRFARAELIGGDEAFEQVVAAVVGFVDDPERGLALPLDVRGTAFQQRVWQALRRVPSGSTVSYSELARLVGAPSAARAVASACAANPLAVVIPCHRVVRRDGGLSGYRWGVERKRALLDRER